jgi:anti-sigma28 factor (negative regulator of flagellin synthesis)
MRQSSEKPDLLTTDATENQAAPKAAVPPQSDLSPAEALQLRQEKLAAIRQAVENGAYDSEALLEKALARMRKTIDLSDDSSDILS